MRSHPLTSLSRSFKLTHNDVSLRQCADHAWCSWCAVRGDDDDEIYSPRPSLQIADECKQLNNFETVHAIVTCLTLQSIRRLTKTWDLISPSTRKTFTQLHSLVHMRGRWR